MERHQPESGGVQRKLGATAQTELAHEAADVRLDSGLSDAQLPGDLLVRQAPRHQAEHIGFTPGERVVFAFRGR